MDISIHTLVFVLAITHLIQVAVLGIQYSINKSYNGIGWWLLWCIAETVGFSFAYLRGIPSISSLAIFMQNAFIGFGAIFMYVGVKVFLNKKVDKWLVTSYSLLYVVAIFFFVYISNSIIARSIIFNASLSIVFFATFWELILRNNVKPRASANFIAILFLFQSCFFMFRVVMISTGTPVNDFFASTFFNYATFFDGIVIGLLWTFGFIIMLNQRLNADVAEATKHFETIFNMSPDAILISTINDGSIHNVNQAFCDVTGFSLSESVGKLSQELPVWANPDDRQRFVSKIKLHGVCENFEAPFLRKDGSQIIGLLSSKVINIKGSDFILSSIRDITERKKDEEELINLKNNLEQLVKAKTLELTERISDLERFHNATIDREIRMAELRDEIKKLKKEL